MQERTPPTESVLYPRRQYPRRQHPAKKKIKITEFSFSSIIFLILILFLIQYFHLYCTNYIVLKFILIN